MKAIVWNSNMKFESNYLILTSIHLLVKCIMYNVSIKLKREICFFD